MNANTLSRKNADYFRIEKAIMLIEKEFPAQPGLREIATHIGSPKAVRAVGSAVGKNPISFIIPCHRVIRKTADFGNYGGGKARKKAMLGWEAAQMN